MIERIGAAILVDSSFIDSHLLSKKVCFEKLKQTFGPAEKEDGSAQSPHRLQANAQAGMSHLGAFSINPLTAKKFEAPLTVRLAVVFVDPLRLKIVTELNRRSLSPTRFFEELGGGSPARVNRHFKALEKHGWLELVETKTGGRRRSATEHFYRATGPAVFDRHSWSGLPDSIKSVYTWNTFSQLAETVVEALKAGTFDARDDRHFSWTPISIDERGWKNVIARVDSLFEFLFREQAEAKMRMAESGEEPLLATAALAVFESLKEHQEEKAPLSDPGSIDAPMRPQASLTASDSQMPFTLRIAKVFDNPLRLKIVTELNKRKMSSTQFFEEFGGGSPSALSRHFKKLEKYGWLVLVDEKTGGRRRSATERFYRATGPAVYDENTWANVPDSIKSVYTWNTFSQLAETVVEALKAGTFDARDDRHFSWTPISIDERGWKNVIARVDSLFEFLFREQAEAKMRMAESGEESILVTVALSVFESPDNSAREP